MQSIANLVAQYQTPETKFKIFCGNSDLDGGELKGVAFNRWITYNENTQVWYASKKSRSIKIILTEIKQSEATVLFIIGIYSWYFNIVPLLFGTTKTKILSVRGMLHPGALSQKPLKKKIYLAVLKLLRVQRRIYFHATDEQEVLFIQVAFGKRINSFIAGNFPRIFDLQPVVQKSAGSLRMTSIALISPMKNIALVLESLQQCTQQIIYDIYGPVKDKRYWEGCIALIQQLPSNISVRYKEAIEPATTEATLSLYDIFILPSKSENFGHAIFEALSAGKPVITGNFTPFNKLATQLAGKNVSIDNTKEITAAINFFASMDLLDFTRWNIGAKAYATKQADMAKLMRQYDVMFSGEGEVAGI